MALEPLKITCTSTDCENGLHCYLQKHRQAAGSASGPCRECGATLIDWDRVHTRNLADVAHTFVALKTELIRHRFWHQEIDEVAINHARRKGRAGMRVAVEKILRQKIGPAQPYRDGAQTPKSENAVHYAQHATATCCRKCVEEWHGIPRGRELTDEELAYCTALVTMYIEERMPYLTENGEYVPKRSQQISTAMRYKQRREAGHAGH